MGFVPRKNKIVFEGSSIDKSSSSETLRKNQTIDSDKIISNLKKDNKTYTDMTIEVLNILDSQGINIYDENRKPGMYQKKELGNEVQINNIIKSLSKDNNKFEDFEEDLTQKIPKNNTNVNELLNFFTKNK